MSVPVDVNEAQWQAINHEGGHLLIVAGPGTGKTHTLIHRIARIVGQSPAGQKILAITFTNKAAQEMQERLHHRFAILSPQIFVGTFHSFCLSILKEFRNLTSLPNNFRVASSEEIDKEAKDIWPNLTRKQRSAYLDEISRFKSIQFDQDQPDFAKEYQDILHAKGLVDYDDLLLQAVRLLKDHNDVAQQLGRRYGHVFVDEFQDINPIQYELLKVLLSHGPIMTGIGDPHQAIYGFRGSDAGFFDRFIADHAPVRTLSLTANYRSSANLLTASSQVIRKSRQFPVAELTAQIYVEGRLTVHACSSDKAEAEYVVHQIERMVGGTSMFSQDSGRALTHEEASVSFGDIAILYRLNSQARLLEQALERSGIPYHLVKKAAEADPQEQDVVCPARDEERSYEAEKVQLMTMHASKGLEFPVVFMLGCEETLLPLQLESLVSDEEEERRLFYVAMTRAKHRLYLLRAKRRVLYGKTLVNNPCPFLKDIEEALKHYEQESTRKPRPKDRQQQLDFFPL
jgi:DNA helicase-2/ATP-dependent DNA helicase PcrA